VLRRLNELGTLARMDTVSAVSGGSILAAFLADRVPEWPKQGQIPRFDEDLVPAFRDFTRKNIRTKWFFKRFGLPWNWARSTVAVKGLEERYHDIVTLRLPRLPDRPRYIFCATDLSWGINWIFERARMGSYEPGYAQPPPDWPVARCVAASSCFPPAFEPLPVDLDPEDLKGGHARRDDERERLIRGLRLTDGGVYDNLGLEPVWKTHEHVFVSDGGATFDPSPDGGAIRRLGRYLTVQSNQAGAVRKRWLIASYTRGEYGGAYVGIGSAVAHYDRNAGGYDEVLVDRFISEVRTDLDYFTDAEAQVLQNHGYLLAEAATLSHTPEFRDKDAPPANAPYPDWLDSGRAEQALSNSHKRRKLGRWRFVQRLKGQL
jgi:NTE family protein